MRGIDVFGQEFWKEPHTIVQLKNGDWFNYDLVCYDGYAIGTLTYPEDEGKAPHAVVVEYPKLSEIRGDKEKEMFVLKNRGLDELEAEDIHYGDVMCAYRTTILEK